MNAVLTSSSAEHSANACARSLRQQQAQDRQQRQAQMPAPHFAEGGAEHRPPDLQPPGVFPTVAHLPGLNGQQRHGGKPGNPCRQAAAGAHRGEIGERRCGDSKAVNRLMPNISITAAKCTKRHRTNRVARLTISLR